ncbi:MAG: hypothetical protein M0Z67_18515 [Nitrospiraceae bacterium]|nr:hypothetical protein [Nitrospiraceae bacterium]
MRSDADTKFFPSLGPLFSLTLVGLLLLSALIYYRAVKIQRFLEPALAISEPRMKFSQDIKDLLSREFSPKEMKGIKFRAGTITVDESLIFERPHSKERPTGPPVLRKLSRVFLTALDNPEMRENISLIQITERFPLSKDMILNRQARFEVQDRAVLILNSLFTAEPRLEKDYTTFFTATAIPAVEPAGMGGIAVEFRIIPTERLHIEVLERLERYTY